MQTCIFPKIAEPIVLALDEVDMLFSTKHYGEFFSMLRAWHNNRATIGAPWDRLDIVLSSSSEPSAFITDHNQSPFNVAMTVSLEDFETKHIETLNQLHHDCFTHKELENLYTLLGGHPYLVRKAMYYSASKQMQNNEIFSKALNTDLSAPFSDLLMHYDNLLEDSEVLQSGITKTINQVKLDSTEQHALQRVGLVKPKNDKVVFRNELYKNYFTKNYSSPTK